MKIKCEASRMGALASDCRQCLLTINCGHVERCNSYIGKISLRMMPYTYLI